MFPAIYWKIHTIVASTIVATFITRVDSVPHGLDKNSRALSDTSLTGATSETASSISNENVVILVEISMGFSDKCNQGAVF